MESLERIVDGDVLRLRVNVVDPSVIVRLAANDLNPIHSQHRANGLALALDERTGWELNEVSHCHTE